MSVFINGKVINLNKSNRSIQQFLFLGILTISFLLCGYLVGFKSAFQMSFLILAAIVPLAGGFFLIRKYQWNNPKFAFLLAAGFIGFITFEWSFLGMWIDERGGDISLSHSLSIAVLFGSITFIAIAAISLLFTRLLVLSHKR
jgi:FtsH-binding integral membrane protein